MSDDTTAGTKKISVESAEAVLGLHWFVARDDGLFAEEGLDVEILRSQAPPPLSGDDPRLTDPKLLDAFNYQKLFEEKKRAALDCHVTQFQRWTSAADTRLNSPLFRQRIESRDAQFGAMAGVQWAEGIVVREPILEGEIGIGAGG